jgi:hypothetical protein
MNDTSEDFAPIAEHLTATAASEKVSDNVRDFGLEFAKGASQISRDVAPDHAYQFEGKFGDKDKLYLAALGNAAKAKGLSQEEVNTTVKWFQKSNTPEFIQRERMVRAETAKQVQAIEKQHLSDRLEAESVLRDEWGAADYHIIVRQINELIDAKTEDERAHLEGVDDNGKLVLNNPQILRQLAADARSKTPPALLSAMKETGLSERQTLDRLMADRNSVYWKGRDADIIQSRYRFLVSGGKENPGTTHASADEELATIQHMMKTNPRAYFRDEKIQSRFRELIDKKESRS